MEVPGLRVESELQPLAYTTTTTTATARLNLSHICNLRHSLCQLSILHPLSRPEIKSASSWILVGFLTCWATIGTPKITLLKVCNSVVFSVFTKLCNDYQYLIPEYSHPFSLPPKESLCPLTDPFYFPLSSPKNKYFTFYFCDIAYYMWLYYCNYYYWCACGMWMFSGQGLNPSHSSDDT